MREAEGVCLEEHAGADAELLADFEAVVGVLIAEVADDGVSAVKEVFANLMEASGLWGGLEVGEIIGEAGEDFEVGEGLAGAGGFGFLEGEVGGPGVGFWMA